MGAQTLKNLGFSNVANLKGGIDNWVQSGKAIKNYLGTFTLTSEQE